MSKKNLLAGKIAGKAVPILTEGAKAVMSVKKASAKMEDIEGSIRDVSRSMEEGIENYRFLQKETYDTGVNGETVYENYIGFTKAMMGTSLQGEKANKIFKEITDAGVIMKTSAEQSKEAFVALSEMIQNETVQAEDLNGKLSEMIPGLFQISADAMKMTPIELEAYIKAGKLKSANFLLMLGAELDKRDKGKLANEANNTSANIEKISNSFGNILGNLGKTDIAKSTGKFLDWVATPITEFAAWGLNKVDEGLSYRMEVSDALKKYGGSYSFGEKLNMYSERGQFNKYVFGKDPAQDVDAKYDMKMSEYYLRGEGKELQSNLSNLNKQIYALTLTRAGKGMGWVDQMLNYDKYGVNWQSHFAMDLSQPEKIRDLSILKSIRDRLVNKIAGEKKALGAYGVVSEANAGADKKNMAATKSVKQQPTYNTTIKREVTPTAQMQKTDCCIPAKDLKNKVGKVLLELISDVSKKTK